MVFKCEWDPQWVKVQLLFRGNHYIDSKVHGKCSQKATCEWNTTNWLNPHLHSTCAVPIFFIRSYRKCHNTNERLITRFHWRFVTIHLPLESRAVGVASTAGPGVNTGAKNYLLHLLQLRAIAVFHLFSLNLIFSVFFPVWLQAR